MLKMSVLPLPPTENSVIPRWCALCSYHTCATAATPTATLSKTALSNNPVVQLRTRESPDLVSEPRSTVDQQRHHQKQIVSSPIDIYPLDLELTDHPDINFVFNLKYA